MLGLCTVYYKPESRILRTTTLRATERTQARKRHCFTGFKAILQSAESW
jgi:hypothetical protein